MQPAYHPPRNEYRSVLIRQEPSPPTTMSGLPCYAVGQQVSDDSDTEAIQSWKSVFSKEATTTRRPSIDTKQTHQHYTPIMMSNKPRRSLSERGSLDHLSSESLAYSAQERIFATHSSSPPIYRPITHNYDMNPLMGMDEYSKRPRRVSFDRSELTSGIATSHQSMEESRQRRRHSLLTSSTHSLVSSSTDSLNRPGMQSAPSSESRSTLHYSSYESLPEVYSSSRPSSATSMTTLHNESHYYSDPRQPLTPDYHRYRSPVEVEDDTSLPGSPRLGGRVYSCTLCMKKFARLYNLKVHLRSHEDSKEFDCEDCGAKFNRSHDLVRHAKTHTKEKPHVCQYCGRGFARRDALKRHEQVDANGKRLCASDGRGRFRNVDLKALAQKRLLQDTVTPSPSLATPLANMRMEE